MPVIQTGQTFGSGDQVTAQKLMDIAGNAEFLTTANTAADGLTIQVHPTGGYLKVPSNGIGSNELASDASTDANRAVDTDHIKDNSVTAAKLDSAAVSVLMPTGSILPYAGSSAPTGYLLCDGSAQDRQVNSVNTALFTALGTTYGVGDGSTTFNIPDLRGRVIAGQDDMGGSSANRLTGNPVNGDNLGATGGSEDHLLTAAESGLPEHTHKIGSQTNGNMVDGSFNVTKTGSTLSTTGVTGGAQPASSAHNNVQPTIILNYIIKT